MFGGIGKDAGCGAAESDGHGAGQRGQIDDEARLVNGSGVIESVGENKTPLSVRIVHLNRFPVHGGYHISEPRKTIENERCKSDI